MPGVNVIVLGTTTGASTNANGEYEITGLPTGVQEIEARFVGYTAVTKEVTVEAGATIELNFELRQTATNLSCYNRYRRTG